MSFDKKIQYFPLQKAYKGLLLCIIKLQLHVCIMSHTIRRAHSRMCVI